ncbi:hypothetical protein KGD82_19895 [Nocardiopsis eucommiae]|uniref:MFS transporter n=1 Tax=Nocardiopsis eucommiae TaxID=2831970 RepID=A0A975QJX3_9ACTN|nr:hypothetical protein KGD82_19895 [Nocardiopsis eucommiae]
MNDQEAGTDGDETPAPATPATEKRGLAGYVSVLRTPGLTVWAMVLVLQRVPVAMAPLALVYLGYAVTGSFLVGGLLVSAHALAEAAAAGWMGRRFDRRPPRGETALVLGAEGVFFLFLFVFAHQLSVPLLVLLAALGGAVSAGTYGGLRSLLQRMVPAHTRPAALGLEETVSATIWAASPALVGVLVAAGAGTWPVGAMAVASFLGGLAALGLPRQSLLLASDQAGEPRSSGAAVACGSSGPPWPRTAPRCSPWEPPRSRYRPCSWRWGPARRCPASSWARRRPSGSSAVSSTVRAGGLASAHTPPACSWSTASSWVAWAS